MSTCDHCGSSEYDDEECGLVRVESRCLIDERAFIGGSPQSRDHCEKTFSEDAHKTGSYRLCIGSGTVIREFACVHTNTVRGVPTRIGKDCYIMTHAVVNHDCQVSDGVTLCSHVSLGGHVTVQEHATIGQGACVHQWCVVGAYAMVGQGTPVTKHVMPFSTVHARAVANNKRCPLSEMPSSKQWAEIFDIMQYLVRGLNYECTKEYVLAEKLKSASVLLRSVCKDLPVADANLVVSATQKFMCAIRTDKNRYTRNVYVPQI